VFLKISNNIPEFSKFNYKEFCEIRMAVSSRIFGVKIDYKKTDVLAPFADLLNHKRPRTTHRANSKSRDRRWQVGIPLA
jgi:histone-lysine N-methyltransferase SETD3